MSSLKFVESTVAIMISTVSPALAVASATKSPVSADFVKTTRSISVSEAETLITEAAANNDIADTRATVFLKTFFIKILIPFN